MSLRPLWRLPIQVVSAWSDDKAPRMGAALAYYSVFSITPLLVLAIGIGGLVFNQDVARKAVLREVQMTVGEPAASTLETMIQTVQNDGHSVWATVVGVVTLLFGATGVFGELQDSLNTVWKVKPKHDRTFWEIVRQRFLSFAVVLGTGFLLLI